MHAALESSSKFNMLHSTKLQLTRFYSTNRNTKAKLKNHYDTLKITPNATQNEVKSAYYKLTLQYHPDKNKSEYAKQKFHDISDAYEVLSNHEQRKIYDRSMLLHHQPMSTATEEPMSFSKHKVYSGTSTIYNFDAWTEAHYGKQMHEKRKRRKIYENYKCMEKLEKKDEDSRYIELTIVVLFIITFFLGSLRRENPDVPVSQRQERK
ncbi:hypothetical protein P5V15_011808 [Pogonomyrmex californicus]